MKKQLLILLSLSLFFGLLANDNLKGFGPVRFADNKKVALEKLSERYNLKKTSPTFYTTSQSTLPEFLRMSIMVDQAYITIKNFSIDDNPFTVRLHFAKTQEGGFYGYSIKSSEKDIISYLENRKYADLLADIFESKFGKPAKVFDYPDIFKIKDEVVTEYKSWAIKGFDIYVGVSYKFKYFIQADVFKSAQREVEQRMIRRDYLQRVNRAATSF